METDVAFRPLKEENHDPDADQPADNGPLIPPHRGKPAGRDEGDAEADGKGGKQPSCLSMGEGEMVLNQREEWGKDGSGTVVEVPETPEDEERPQSHLFHTSQTRRIRPRSRCFIHPPLLLSPDILIKEVILHAHGIDNAKDNHGLLPVPGPIETSDPQPVFFPKASEGGFIKGKDLFGQLLESFLHKPQLSSVV